MQRFLGGHTLMFFKGTVHTDEKSSVIEIDDIGSSPSASHPWNMKHNVCCCFEMGKAASVAASLPSAGGFLAVSSEEERLRKTG